MVFNGKECLQVARFLGSMASGPCTLESVQRAAINRAYYAAYGHAFHCEVDAGRYRQEKGKGSGKNHSGIRQHFKDGKGKDGKGAKSQQIATELEELHLWRKLCDYEKIVMVPLPITGMLSKAEHVVNSVK